MLRSTISNIFHPRTLEVLWSRGWAHGSPFPSIYSIVLKDSCLTFTMHHCWSTTSKTAHLFGEGSQPLIGCLDGRRQSIRPTFSGSSHQKRLFSLTSTPKKSSSVRESAFGMERTGANCYIKMSWRFLLLVRATMSTGPIQLIVRHLRSIWRFAGQVSINLDNIGSHTNT